jgi:hypothetical protein
VANLEQLFRRVGVVICLTIILAVCLVSCDEQKNGNAVDRQEEVKIVWNEDIGEDK